MCHCNSGTDNCNSFCYEINFRGYTNSLLKLIGYGLHYEIKNSYSENRIKSLKDINKNQYFIFVTMCFSKLAVLHDQSEIK